MLFAPPFSPPSIGGRAAPHVHIGTSPPYIPPAEQVSAEDASPVSLCASSDWRLAAPPRARTHSAYFLSTGGRIVWEPVSHFCLVLTAPPVAKKNRKSRVT